MSKNNEPVITSNTHLQAELSSDLHWALSRVPIQAHYYSKLDDYAAELIENYNWTKLHEYTTSEELDLLTVGSRITTADNNLAVKTEDGWFVLYEQGMIDMNLSSDSIALPAFSVPSTKSERHQS